MSSGSNRSRRSFEQFLREFQKLSPTTQLVIVGIGIAFFLGMMLFHLPRQDSQNSLPPAVPPGDYLFAFWNVGDFFDDQDNPNEKDAAEDWFGQNAEAFRLKADCLAEIVTQMNGGRGPDILAMCEVESRRSLEALREAANQRLEAAGHTDAQYSHILFIEDRTGRGFAPAILTRLPVVADRTRKLGSGGLRRILEGHIISGEYELTVIVAHWTSRVSDAQGVNRMKYAESCYGRYRAILHENPNAAVIICGDFNDDIQDASLKTGLRIVTDRESALAAREPRPLNLMAGFDRRKEGTIYYRGWSVFDHIHISRGMLDGPGWRAVPESIAIFATDAMREGKNGEPKRFQRKFPLTRGYSDHFPVTVQLKIQTSTP